MALAGLNRYFKRGPTGFYPMQHFDISDMFGRRQRPVLRLELSDPILGSSGGGRHQVRIIASLINDGRASAVAPFARLQVESPFQVNALGFASRVEGSPLRFVTEASQPPAYAVVGRTDFLVHPKLPFQIAEITAEIRERDRVPACIVRCSLAAIDAPVSEISLMVEPIRIAAALGRLVEGDPRA